MQTIIPLINTYFFGTVNSIDFTGLVGLVNCPTATMAFTLIDQATGVAPTSVFTVDTVNKLIGIDGS